MWLRGPITKLCNVGMLTRSDRGQFLSFRRHCYFNGKELDTNDRERYYTLPVSFHTRTPGEKMTMDVGVWEVRPITLTTQTPLVVTLHGTPGSSQNFGVIGRRLAEHGIRVIGFDFPGFGKSRLFEQNIYRLDHSTEGRYQMFTTILNTLGICRIDVLLSHSAGTWLNYKAAADLQYVKSSVILNPLGKRPHRAIRPSVIFKLLASVLKNPFLHSKFKESLPFLYKRAGFKLVEEEFSSLPIAFETAVRPDYEKMQGYAEKMSSKKHPFVMAITKNDKIVEIQIAIEMAQHLGIEEGDITSYTNGSETIGHPVGKYDDKCYRRVILFEKGGHFVHKINETEILHQILKLVAVVRSHTY